MTTYSANYALGKAIKSAASTSNSIWSNRVYRIQAPPTSTRPYLIYLFSSGIKPQNTSATDAEIIMTIKCVAESAVDSEKGAIQIAELFDNLGQSRVFTLDCSPDWILIKSQLRNYISLIENIDSGATQLYHDGAVFRFLLQKLT